MTYRPRLSPYPVTARQCAIARDQWSPSNGANGQPSGPAPWTRPDFLYSREAQAINAAWIKASRWDPKREPKREVETEEQGGTDE